MDRLSDQVCDKVDDALTRMLAFGEQVDSIEFAMALLPTTNGIMPVGIVYVGIKGPVLGTVLFNADVVLDLSLLASQDQVDGCVRQSLDQIRSRKAAILANSNGHFDAGGPPR